MREMQGNKSHASAHKLDNSDHSDHSLYNQL